MQPAGQTPALVMLQDQALACAEPPAAVLVHLTCALCIELQHMAWCALAPPPRQPACWAVAAAVPVVVQLSSLNTTLGSARSGLSTAGLSCSCGHARDWDWTRAGLGLVRSSEAVRAGGLYWRGIWWCLAPLACKGGLCRQLLLRWLSSPGAGAAGSEPPRLVVSCSCGGSLYCMVWPAGTLGRAGAGTVWSAGAGVCSFPGAGDLPWSLFQCPLAPLWTLLLGLDRSAAGDGRQRGVPAVFVHLWDVSGGGERSHWLGQCWVSWGRLDRGV